MELNKEKNVTWNRKIVKQINLYSFAEKGEQLRIRLVYCNISCNGIIIHV